MTERSVIAGEEAPGTPLGLAFRHCAAHFGFAAGFSGLLNLLYLAPTLYMLQVYDRVVPTRGKLTLLFLTLVVGFALATLSVLDYYRSRLLVRASARLDHLLSGPILRMLLSAPKRGAISTQSAMRDFDALRQAMTGVGILALFDAPWTPVYVMICFGLSPLLGLVALGGVLILLALTALNSQQRSLFGPGVLAQRRLGGGSPRHARCPGPTSPARTAAQHPSAGRGQLLRWPLSDPI